MFFPVEDNLNHQIKALLDSTESHEYKGLPASIKGDLTHTEWLWHPDKANIIDEYCMPEVSNED